MTHIRCDLTMTEARNHLKAALWDQHGEHISQADHKLVTLYAECLVLLTKTHEELPHPTNSELTKYLSTLVAGLHANIARGE